MTSPRRDDWSRVREVFEAALAQPAERRSTFVAEACRGETGIHEQVVHLLAAHEGAADFLETPAARLLGDARHPDFAGRQIGPYQLETRIGSGGMGEVYRARDTRLHRTVAIKVLPANAAGDPPARERFEREARAVAALNHPHICTLHDVGRHDGVEYLVMEFLEGATLGERLERGALPVAQALPIAIEIASALDRAHRSGIVHRDLKPRNVMLTRAGAKLLDFGLAKTTTPALVVGDGKAVSSELTAPGTILGTLQYMAPEQLAGRTADARTDLFAFGCVLYEMVTGKKAFDARSSASLLTAIMAQEPTPVRQLQPGVPPNVEYVIARCLEKDPDDRWQTARDLLAELKRTASGPDGTLTAGRAIPRSSLAAVAIATAAVVAAVAGTWLLWRPVSGPASPPLWLSLVPPPGGSEASSPVVSPNGRYVVFKAEDASHRQLLWVKDLFGPDARPVPGTDGVEETEPPFWSPDSRSIAFFAHGAFSRVDISGGTPQRLAAAAEPRGGTWTPSGVIIFDKGDRLLYQMPASGGAATLVPGTGPGQVRLFPHALPDGRQYLFTSRNVNGLGEGIYLASLVTSEVRRVSDAWSPAVYAAGHLLFGRQRALFAQPFDLSRLVTTGEPRRLADGIGIGCCTPLSFQFSASSDVLVFWSGTRGPGTQLQWVGRDGKPLTKVGEPARYAGLSLSHDGRRVALERGDPTTNGVDIWLLDLASNGPPARRTLDGRASNPVWSPDDRQLLVMYRARGLVAIPAASGTDAEIVADPASKWPTDWSPDGSRVAFLDALQGWRLMTMTTNGHSEPVLYRQASSELGMMRFHPRGGWVAYISEETGQLEVYIDSFPTPGQKTRISTGGGKWPMWRSDGKELFYLGSDRSLMAAAISADPGNLRASSAMALFEAPAVGPDRSRIQFAPSADGSRFLFNARVPEKTQPSVTVITNWPALLSPQQPH